MTLACSDMLVDLLSETTIVESDDKLVDRLMAKIKESEDNLIRVISDFRYSDRLREIGPLMILPLCDFWLASKDPKYREQIFRLLNEISTVCRHHEVYTFLLECWVDKDREIRSLLLQSFSNIFRFAKKGPVAKKKTQFLTQVVGLVTSIYFHTSPLKDSDMSMVDPTIELIKSVTFYDAFDVEITSNDFAEICRKDLVACLLLRLNKFLFRISRVSGSIDLYAEKVSEIHETFLSGTHRLSNVYDLILRRAKSLKEKEVETGNLEVNEDDIAYWISSTLRLKKFPWFLNKMYIADLLMKAARFHATTDARTSVEDFNAASELIDDQFQWSDVLESCLGEMINLAISAPPTDGPLGSSDGLSVEQRQSVYLSYRNFMMTCSLTQTLKTTWKLISGSKSDACVGIYAKVAKDAWAQYYGCNHGKGTGDHSGDKEGCCHEERVQQEAAEHDEYLMKIVRNVMGSEFSILDGVDSLFAVLNWLRFVAIRNPEIIKQHKETISTYVNIQARKIDAELINLRNKDSATSTANNRELAHMGMQVIAVSDILKRVKELAHL